MMKLASVTMYCRHKSEEAAQAHVEMITKINRKNLVDFGVGYDDARGWRSWTTRKKVQDDE